jgi:hypothetical protein
MLANLHIRDNLLNSPAPLQQLHAAVKHYVEGVQLIELLRRHAVN